MLKPSVTRLSGRIFKLVLATSLSLSLSTPAWASLEQTLGPIPEDTPVLLTGSLDLLRWQYPLSKLGAVDQLISLDEFGLDKQVVQEQLNELKRFFTDDLKFDPALDGLLNLGTHLSVGYRPAAGSEGHLLFSLNLRSGARVSELLNRLSSEAAKQAGIKMIKQSFGGHELYQIKSPTLLEGEVFRDLTLAVSGNNLIGTLGNGDSLLKNMLYVDQVLPLRSHFRIGNQATFKPVKESLEKELAWVYIDTLRGLKATGIETLAEGEELEFIGEILSLNRGVGVGFDLNPDGLRFKSFQVPDWASLKPAQREQLASLQTKPVHALKPLLQQVPNQPVFFTAGQRLDISLDPKTGPRLPESLGLSNADQITRNLKELFNLNYETELLPLLDGRYGFGVFVNDGPQVLPSAVFYLGLKDGKEQAFDKLMQQQFHFSPQAMEKLLGSSSKASTRSNLYRAQIMVESFAADSDEGLYAPSIEALRADSEELGSWQELTNPVTGRQGNGFAYANYSEFKGTADQIGMIFYEPLGELKAVEGVKGYDAYRLYGYDASGELYRLDDDGYESVRDDLPTLADLPVTQDPQAIRPKLRETYQGLEIYSLPLQTLFQALIDQERDPLTSAAVSNLYALQAMIETFAVDQDGIYPENLKLLKAAAQESDYWKEFRDPLNSGRLTDKLLAEYSEFKGTADQIGMLFYEPVKRAGQQAITDYVVYAYGPDGKLYALANQDGFKFVNRSNLPQAQAYLDQPKHPLKRVDPVFARKDQLWLLASDPASLKAALDGHQPAKLQNWLNQPPQKSVEPEQLVFLDLESLSPLIKQFQDQNKDKQEKPDPVMAAILQALKPWRSLFGTVYQVPAKGTESQLALDVDLDQASLQDWVKVGEAYENELQTAQNFARRSSVKANMHTLQTLVETYAVDSEGVYPENLDDLQQAAEKMDYWRVTINPFDAESPSMSDYQTYQPGPDFIGRVFYEPVYDSSGQITSYKIYGADEQGQLIQDKSGLFFLSNY